MMAPRGTPWEVARVLRCSRRAAIRVFIRCPIEGAVVFADEDDESAGTNDGAVGAQPALVALGSFAVRVMDSRKWSRNALHTTCIPEFIKQVFPKFGNPTGGKIYELIHAILAGPSASDRTLSCDLGSEAAGLLATTIFTI